MTQINQNFDLYNTTYRANPQPQQGQPVRIPDYYYVPDSFESKSAKEVLEENPLYSIMLKQFIEHPIAILGTWLGFGLGLDAYSKANKGAYEKSLVARVANFGDKIENSAFIQSKPAQSVIKGLGSIKTSAGNAVKNNSIVKAMRETPSLPEWPMARSQMFNQKQEVVQEFLKITDALKLGTAEAIPMNDKGISMGITKAEKEMLKKAFNVAKFSQIPEEQAINHLLLHRLGRSPEEIKKIMDLGSGATAATKKEILKEMGISAETLKNLKEDVSEDSIKKVEEASRRVMGKVKIGAGNFRWLGPLTAPFKRTIGCDEIHNRLHSMGDGAKTGTGRFLSKFMQTIHRGFTFGGGKLGGLIFIAPFLVEVMMNVKKADKDQKVGTLANGLVESVSWVFTFPLALKIMHFFGGAQHAGLTKTEVEKIRKIRKDFNDNNKLGLYAEKNVYKAERKKAQDAINDIIEKSNYKKQGFFTKAARKAARFMNIDLCRFDGRNTGSSVKNIFTKVRNLPRNLIGVPMRFGIWGLLSMGLLGGALTKATSAIFGKYYDSMKEDERKDEKKNQKKFLKEDLNKRLIETQLAKQSGGLRNQPQVNPQASGLATRGLDTDNFTNQQMQGQITVPKDMKVDNYTEIPSSQNLILQNQNKKEVDNYEYIPSSDNVIAQPLHKGKADTYSYIPSSENVIPSKNENNKNLRTYIPSQAAANIVKNYDNSGLQSALERADRAELKAIQVLSGNFEGM